MTVEYDADEENKIDVPLTADIIFDHPNIIHMFWHLHFVQVPVQGQGNVQ